MTCLIHSPSNKSGRNPHLIPKRLLQLLKEAAYYAARRIRRYVIGEHPWMH
jgi:hypothetical protein